MRQIAVLSVVSGVEKDNMNNPEAEHRIQPRADVGELPPSSGDITDSPRVQDSTRRAERRQRTVAAGTVFGAFVGLPMGAVLGAACCWLIGQFDFLSNGVLIGIFIGPLAGAFIGFMERKLRGDLVRPDTATFIGIVFGLFPALLLGLGGLSGVTGRFSGYLLVGAVFVGPMCGLLIGGILDRAFEESLKKSWGMAVTFAVLGVAVCVGLVCLIDSAAYGPDPKEVSREAKKIITREWSMDPELRDAAVQNVTLEHKGRTTYTGFANVTFAGQPERLSLEVLAEGDMLTVSWTAAPSKEQDR